MPNIGVICKIPDNSTTDLELKRLCIQSTKKNIKVEREPCITINNIPETSIFASPQQNVK